MPRHKRKDETTPLVRTGNSAPENRNGDQPLGTAFDFNALIEKIKKALNDSGAENRVQLLQYLFDNRHEPISGKDLAAEFYTDQASDHNKWTRVRVAVGDLRHKLGHYAMDYANGDGWECSIPINPPSVGYQLIFRRVGVTATAVEAFWQAHLLPLRDIAVVYNEPLFFRDRKHNTVLRYMNGLFEQSDPKALQKELKIKHPEVREDSLYPCRFYLLSGEILARDRLRQWFTKEAGIDVRMRVSSHVNVGEITSGCPILLGNPSTNQFIRQFLDNERHAFLDYRMDPERVGVIEIRNYNKTKEQGALAGLSSEYLREEDNSFTVHDSPEADKRVFALVTRIPNPYGEGAITIIASWYSRVLEKVAEALTTESVMSALLDSRLQWSRFEPLPQRFQALFSVRMGPLSIDGPPGELELISHRRYDNVKSLS